MTCANVLFAKVTLWPTYETKKVFGDAG